MSSSKSFDRQTASRSSEEVDRALQPDPAELIAAEASWQLPYSPQAIGDDAPWRHPLNAAPRAQMMLGLQRTIGNQAVQRMMAQRRGKGSFTVDEDVQARIQRERSGGQPLDPAVQVQMSRSIGHDFSNVRVHASTEADDLSKRLGAIAFTNGHDIFFRAGKYDPASSSGQELLAHELTHVVQQSSGAVGTHQRMTVSPPDDAYEQAADAVARQVMTAAPYWNQSCPSTPVSEVQREEVSQEDEEPLQTKVDLGMSLQREDVPEEEEQLQTKIDPGVMVQRQEMPEEEGEIQTKADPSTVIQREEIPEEEEQPLQTKVDPGAVIQRQEMPEEEENIQTKVDPGAVIQREEMPEEEEQPLQTKAEPGTWVQRQDEEREPVAPVPDVSGQGEVFQDVAFARPRALPRLQGRTNATFRNSFQTEGLTTEAGEGCRGCRPRDCVHVTGSLVSEFTVTTRVTLPRVPRGFSPCEREQIQNAIDTTLADHEQEHVAAFETYNGTENTPIDITACRGRVDGMVRNMHRAIERPRRADARAASAALDPFTFDYTVEPCED